MTDIATVDSYGYQMTDKVQSWVPCVAGNLFFDLVDPNALGSIFHNVEQHNFRHTNANDVLTHTCFVYSENDWQDEKLTNNNEGLFHVVLFFSCENYANNRCGHILLVPKDMADSIELLKLLREKSETLMSALLTTKSKEEYDALSELEQLGYRFKVDEAVIDLGNTIAMVAHENPLIVSICFDLAEDGFVSLMPGGGNGWVTGINNSRDMFEKAYYVVKYAFHRHQHHNHHADSLIGVYSASEAPEKILFDLKEAVVLAKRNKHPGKEATFSKAINDARGILAYAKSYVSILATRNTFDEQRTKQELLLLSNMGESLVVMSESNRRTRDDAIAVDARSKAVIVFLLSALGPLVLVFKDELKRFLVDSFVSPRYAAINYFMVVALLYWGGRYFMRQNLSINYSLGVVHEFLVFITKDRRGAFILSAVLVLLAILVIYYLGSRFAGQGL